AEELSASADALDNIRVLPRGIWEGVYTTEQAIERGRPQYQEHCAACHGTDLAGFRTPLRPLKGEALLKKYPTAGHLFSFIRGNMPARGTISDDIRADILAYILQ